MRSQYMKRKIFKIFNNIIIITNLFFLVEINTQIASIETITNRNKSISNQANIYQTENSKSFNLLQNLKEEFPLVKYENNMCNFDDTQKVKACSQFLRDLTEFIFLKSEASIILNDLMLNETCLNSLNTLGDITPDGQSKISKMIGLSGKNLQDFGLEDCCKFNGYHYYFFTFNVKDTSIFNDIRYDFLYEFLAIEKFSIGACFLEECSNLILNYFNKEKNKKFYDFLSTKKIINLEVSDSVTISNNRTLSRILIIFGFYILFKILCSFLFSSTKVEKKRNKIKHKDNLLDNGENNDVLNNNSLYSEEFTEIFFTSEEKSGEDVSDIKANSEKKKPGKFQTLLIFLYDYFSIQRNFIHMTDCNNVYYDERKLLIFNYLKCFLLFLITFSHVFYASINLPHRDFFQIGLFRHFLFGFFKIAMFSLDCYVALEALTFTFKLMNFIKKNGNEFKVFFKFYLFSFPKIFVFLIIYFIIGIQFKYWGNFFGKNFVFNKSLMPRYESKACFSSDPFIIFNIFDLLYGGNDCEFYEKCFRFLYIYVNMFVSFNLIIVIFYFSLRFKNKKFDYFVTFVVFLFFSTAYLNFNKKPQNQKFTLSLVMGELLSMKFTHLFFVKYFLGILSGLFFFYSNETILIDSYINERNYLPFEYIYNFLVYLDIKETNEKFDKKCLTNPPQIKRISFNKSSTANSSNSVEKVTFISTKVKETKRNNRKIFFLFFTFCVQLFIGFYFLVKIWITCSSEFDYLNYSSELEFFYFYEKYVYVAMFVLQIMVLSLTKEFKNFNSGENSRLFYLYGRINLSLFCLIDMVVYIFLTQYDIEFFFSYQNEIFLTLGACCLLFLFAFIITFLFELPIRKIIKIAMK